MDFVEPLTAYNEAKSLTLAEPRLRCAKQTESIPGYFVGLGLLLTFIGLVIVLVLPEIRAR